MKAELGKRIIYGCDATGSDRTPYLTRYTLVASKAVQVCLHVFHRSDADDLHDHPWPFASLILWGGYFEHVACDWCHGCEFGGPCAWPSKRRVRPGQILFRRSTHSHRVELIDGKRAITLVFMGRRRRRWGFFTRNGWQHWKEYLKERGC